jgi:hypothetical protein
MTRDSFDRFATPDRGLFGNNEMAEQKRPGSAPRVTGASDLIDLDMILHNDNPQKKAIAVSYRANTPFADWKWLPRSLIEYEKNGRQVRVTMPEHVALQNGLI